ncbi:hypothetical protein GTP38_23200 [Duganella sp. FT94W]|uniref:NrS-1 polymerase-like helicase domain-containing protein n=1 Tax=Duganella lactea TaxID=2692173 RepID=A0ABW9VER5_9BURK|nr:primase-helicase family protein [Duganella lactea]MYM37237.1 hypothetical protein [Duganella lactea]
MKKSLKTFIHSIASAIKNAFAPAAQKPALGPTSTPNINAILLNLCEGDHDRALWVLRWLAYPLQHEGTKMATSLLVGGVAGSGKSLFFDQVIAPMYGPRAVKAHDIGSPFNSWMLGKLFAVADDFRTSSISPAKLKAMLTNSTTMIRSKGESDRLQKNRLNFVFLSGDVNPLKPEACDRRFMVLEPNAKLAPTVYAAAAGEIANGGIEAFYDFLRDELDMESFNEKASPVNKAINVKEAA